MTDEQKRDQFRSQTWKGIMGPPKFDSLEEYYNSPEYKAWQESRPETEYPQHVDPSSTFREAFK